MNRSWPIRAFAILVAGLASVAQAAGPLPIRPGNYVLVGTPCADAPFAAMFHYDGHALSGAHESHCTTMVAGGSGADVRLSTTCRALGDGTPATPSTVVTRYRIHSASDLGVVEGGREARRYRWCGTGR